MDIALAAGDFIRHGTYLRNWSPRTVATYRTGINALCRAVGNDSELTKPTYSTSSSRCVSGG